MLKQAKDKNSGQRNVRIKRAGAAACCCGRGQMLNELLLATRSV